MYKSPNSTRTEFQSGKVAVVIVNWNGAAFLRRCLTALMQQIRQPDEIIFVDNASSDDSLSIVREFPNVKLVALPENTGFARGNNTGIEAASPDIEWVALLNPDAYPEPAWLEMLLKAADKHRQYDFFGSRLLVADAPDLLDGMGDAYHFSGLVWRTGHGRRVDAGSEKSEEIFSPCAAAAIYRKTALLEVGGFDEAYFCYVEDVDLGFRLRLAGYRCLTIPESVVLHVGSGTTGGQHSDFAVYHGHRNLVWTFVKNMPGLLFWILLPPHLMLNLLSLIWLSLRGQGKVLLRAKRDAVKGLPRVWRERREIQQRRKVNAWEIWRLLDKNLGHRSRN